jgi:hypothetical protein
VYSIRNAECTTAAGQKHVYKEYKGYVTPNTDSLHAFTTFYEDLSAWGKAYLDSMCAWPHAMVTENGYLTGFLMIKVPDKFYRTINFSSGPKLVEAKFEHLLLPGDLLRRRGINLTGKTRYELLLSVVRGLDFFHEHGICVGDFSHSNILFSLTDATVFFLDCDSFHLNGSTVFEPTETGNWSVAERYPDEPVGTPQSDVYKLGLLALRLLMESDKAAYYHASANIERLPAGVDARVGAVIEGSLLDASNRPTIAEWDLALKSAIASCTSELEPVTDPDPVPEPAQPTRGYRAATPEPVPEPAQPTWAYRAVTPDPTPPGGIGVWLGAGSTGQPSKAPPQSRSGAWVGATISILLVAALILIIAALTASADNRGGSSGDRGGTQADERPLAAATRSQTRRPDTSTRSASAASQPSPKPIGTDSIALNATELTLEMGEVFQLTAAKSPTNSEDPITFRAADGNITVDQTGLVLARRYDDGYAGPWDTAVEVTSGEVSRTVQVQVVNSHGWDWRDENWKIDKVNASTMVFDHVIRDCTGFTLGVNLTEGDLGDWDIYVYQGGGGTLGEADRVGRVRVTSLGEAAYSKLAFSQRDVAWILIRPPVDPDGSYRGWRLSVDLQAIEYDGYVH